mmetsp:Transcript_11656/g.17669  ORF Transcript_11656/g.17669 Transcript_11656/m.17669 type:complete len:332 (+) Transcript_11656:138-1133(+)|eukprot:CAMPEP_0185032286 /NCGR_PEP_ID=MMETSP1103-20130426/20247_1 /TAXON_ID=36769 /ORGANISM="Paraphysomonas bandaiensis, Strain Caron Lab Isolate" /LENGTH=331 /DNA_ID=CAMNT_0027568119 /DNA_START=61 /DNA_END=1056 /DNA_ORIENTATION=+
MGGAASSFRSNSKPVEEEVIERRPPLTLAEEVLGSAEAIKRVQDAVEEVPPGESNRWATLLMVVNRDYPPTEEEPDPLRLDINLKELKVVLKATYDNISSAASDGIVLMREHYPRLYQDHDATKAKRVSQKERNEKKMSEDMWAYGELNNEVFATIYEKVSKAYGVRKSSKFYDLGCGVGQLVYTAAFIGDFSECNGIEMITPLLEAGERKTKHWNKIKSKFPENMRKLKMNWFCDDFIKFDEWVEATFILLHWTALNNEQTRIVSNKMEYCDEGTIVVAFTHPVQNPNFELLIHDSCRVSWGEAEFFVQIKNSPPKPRRRQDKSSSEGMF